MGVSSLARIMKSDGRLRGRPYSWVAIVLGLLMTGMFLLAFMPD